ncbi:class I SAM-dependent DNA methyltransferase [Marinobacter sp. C2H3]|uniref:class I SAM-dependent DNA methyltransferase n=1 Tax=Marinobacter sp. C2H3 TaxID=3119003 RepID=UPI00300F3103
MPTSTQLYTDLSGYYDLMCADIDYRAQSNGVHRLHQLFGNGGHRHLDLACGTGPHLRYFLDWGYRSDGLDIHQPMLNKAQLRCPEAGFILGDMGDFSVEQPMDLITCFLYSVHYSQTLERLQACFASAHRALTTGGTFCFNLVDKHRINNRLFVSHTATQPDGEFTFRSGWHYAGHGEGQSLKLRIQREAQGVEQVWEDEHAMVALGIEECARLLATLFEVHIFEHDYSRIAPWDGQSGNALFVCVKA